MIPVQYFVSTAERGGVQLEQNSGAVYQGEQSWEVNTDIPSLSYASRPTLTIHTKQIMSLVVSDRKDELSKPPPKKKWLQNYIEEDTVTSPIGSNLRNETHKFVQLLEPQSNEGLKQFKAADTPTKLTLSQDVIGGVVQGVIDQFQNFFENDLLGNHEDGPQTGAPKSSDNEMVAEKKEDPLEPPKLLQKDIQPVVQSVISQFLNGSLSDSGFRRSRKRSHKHINCRHKDKSGASSYNSSEGPQRRSSSVIQLRNKNIHFNGQSHIKVRKIETLMRTNLEGNEEALNLSCPKKVTFAAEDKCYSVDSISSFQNSKSGEENILKSHSSWGKDERKMKLLAANPSVRPASTPVIFYSRTREASPCIDQPLNLVSLSPPLLQEKDQKTHKFSSLPATRQSSPMETFIETQARKEGFTSIDNHGLKLVCKGVTPYPVIKPKPLNLTSAQTGRKMFTSGFSSKTRQSPESQLVGESREEIKRSASNTREVHNRLEKNRRAHLKACFDELAGECDLDPRKASNLMVIRSAYKCIMALRRQEREQEKNLAALVQEKIKRQSQLNELKREFPGFGQDSDSD